MKKQIFVFIILLSSSNILANAIHEANFRADKEQYLIQSGLLFSETIEEINNKNNNSSSRVFLNRFEYGISENISISSTFNFITKENEKGFSNPNIQVKGQYDSFFYQIGYFYSPEKIKDNNFYEGGSYLNFIGTLQLEKEFGLRLNYRPEFDYKINGRSGKNTRGMFLEISAYHETLIYEKILGINISISSTEAGSIENITSLTSSEYLGLSTYMNIKVCSYEVLPRFSFYSYLGSNPGIERSITDAQIEIRKRF